MSWWQWVLVVWIGGGGLFGLVLARFLGMSNDPEADFVRMLNADRTKAGLPAITSEGKQTMDEYLYRYGDFKQVPRGPR